MKLKNYIIYQKQNNMEYIQIDDFNGNLNIICKNDGSGDPLIFETLKEAQDTLEDNCQNGYIVPLSIDIIYLIKELVNAVDDKTKIVHIGDLIANVLDEDL